MTPDDLMGAYVAARCARVPVEQMGRTERGGRHLLLSAANSPGGTHDVGEAIVSALRAGEVAVAVALADRFLPEVEPGVPGGGNGNFASSGEYVVP